MYRTPRRAGRRAPWRITALVALAALVTLPALALVALSTAPAAHAANTSPLISWDPTMLYNGNAEGPVGEHARVHGSGFTSFAGMPLNLGLVFGDTTVCNQRTFSVGTVTPDTSGAFDFAFQWPALANTTGGSGWSICANKSDGTATGNADSGPFTVLSDKPPAIAVSATTVQAGGTITVTGTSWLPAQGNISVYVGQCAACDGAIYVSKIAQSDQSGSFSATLAIPPAVPATTAVVGAGTTNGVLVVSPQDSPSLTITALPETATVEPSPTTTSTTTSTTAPTQGGQGDQTTSGGANIGLIIGLVVGILLLLGVIIGAVVFLLIKRGQPPSDSGGPGGPGGGYGSGFGRQMGVGPGRFDTPGGYGPPRSVPMAPVPAKPNLWNDDWNAPRTTEYPSEGTGYPGDAPTNPGHPGYPRPDDPYR